MRRFVRRVGVAAVVAGILPLGAPAVFAQAAGRATTQASETNQAVFVQTNDPHGNAVVAFRRHADGTLTQAATYPTGR